jgi:type III secretion protein T
MPIEILQQGLVVWALTLTRTLIAFMVMPILAEPLVPSQLRNGVIMIMSMFLLPLTFPALTANPITFENALFILIKEGIIGFTMGYVLSIPFWALRAAGFLIDMQRGAMSALMFSQQTESMATPIGNLFSMLLNVLLMTTGGFLLLLNVIFTSYQVWPVESFIPHINPLTIKFILSQFDSLMYTAILIAAPIMAILFLIDIGSGLVGRFLPQLNIFLQAMPIKSAVAFFLLILYLNFIADYIKEIFFKMDSSFSMLESLLK